MVVWAAAIPAAIKFGGAVLGGLNSMGLFGGSSASKAAERQYNYQRLLNQQAYDLTQQGYIDSPMNQRLGLEKAGYNPLLALGGGGLSYGSYSGGSASAPMDSTASEMGNMLTNAYQVFNLMRKKNTAEIQSIRAGVDNTNADTALKAEYAMTEQAKRTQMEFQNSMLDVQKHLAQKDLSWKDRLYYSQVYRNMQEAENYSAIANIKKYEAETNRKMADINADRYAGEISSQLAESEWRRFHPRQVWILDNARRYGGIINGVYNAYRDKGSSSVSNTTYNVNPATGQVKNVKKSYTKKRR